MSTWSSTSTVVKGCLRDTNPTPRRVQTIEEVASWRCARTPVLCDPKFWVGWAWFQVNWSISCDSDRGEHPKRRHMVFGLGLRHWPSAAAVVPRSHCTEMSSKSRFVLQQSTTCWTKILQLLIALDLQMLYDFSGLPKVEELEISPRSPRICFRGAVSKLLVLLALQRWLPKESIWFDGFNSRNLISELQSFHTVSPLTGKEVHIGRNDVQRMLKGRTLDVILYLSRNHTTRTFVERSLGKIFCSFTMESPYITEPHKNSNGYLSGWLILWTVGI